MNVILSLLFVLMLAATPLNPVRVVQEQTKPKSSVPLKDLRNAPGEVMVDNRILRLTTMAWRDFAPGSGGPNGTRPLLVGFRIVSPDKRPLPMGIRVDRAWVLYGEEVWEVSDLRNRIADQDHAEDSWIGCSNSPNCEITLRDGPQWGVGAEVDVIVRFTDSEGKQHFLQTPKQLIIATQ